MRYLLLLLLMLTPLQAQEAPTYMMKSLYNCQRGDCQEQFGTCVLIKVRNGHAWFLTAKHAVGGNPSVKINNHYYNLSVIQHWNSPGAVPDGVTLMRSTEPVPRSEGECRVSHLKARIPKVGEKVWILGYPLMKFKYVESTITQVNRFQFQTRHHLKSGASGGLVLYRDDETFAGIIHGYLGGNGPDAGEGSNTRGDYIHSKMTGEFSDLLSSEKLPLVKSPSEPPVPVPVKPGISKVELEDTLKKWKLDQDKSIKESIESIVAANDSQHKSHQQELEQSKEESKKQYAELKDFLSNINNQFHEEFKKQDKKIDVIDKRNKTFQEKFRDKIENPDGFFGKGGGQEEVIVEDVPYLPPEITESPDVKQRDGGSSVFSSIGNTMVNLPWLSILGGLGVAVPGGAAGFLALKGLNLLLTRRRNKRKDRESKFRSEPEAGEEVGESSDNTQPPVFQAPKRDLSEAKQILGLRQYEQREPVLDALRGVLFSNELQNNPDQSLKDAFNSVNNSFNEIAPITTQHEVQTAQK